MQIEIRAGDRLRGAKAIDLASVLTSVAHTVRDGALDPLRLRVVCDWVQYKHNFREPVDVHRIAPLAVDTARAHRGLGSGTGHSEEQDRHEIAIDLRRAPSVDLDRLLGCSTSAISQNGGHPSGRVFFEPWGPGTASCIWSFNALYWKSLGLWEKATGREYEQALPSGESDARNVLSARELVLELFRVWDQLAQHRALPEDLHVLELGVGNGNQARAWLDEFLRLDRERGGEYYRRLHYLMGDYSPHVLERARANVGQHAERVSSLVLDATRPGETLRFLRSKAFLIYISNVYDNLPTDEIVRLGGHLYRVETRAYVNADDATRLAAGLGVEAAELPQLVEKLLLLGPDLLAGATPDLFPAGPLAAVRFWSDVWEALRLEERFVPIEGLDTYEVTPDIGGEVLRPIVEANGDIRMHVGNGAAASFVNSLPLLHPFGVLYCHDLFVTDVEQYRTAFRGPGKYDGSVVNWVNGPLLQTLGRRNGFDVDFKPFEHRAGSNVTTLSARMRE